MLAAQSIAFSRPRLLSAPGTLSLPGYEISSVCLTPRGVGGDLFDVFRLGGESVALCVGDGMGRGRPAAALGSRLRAAVQAAASYVRAPRLVCARVNRALCSQFGAGEFATCFYGRLDLARRRLFYTRAGHNAAILARGDGTIVRLMAGGGLLGAFGHWTYGQGRIDLREGDRLVLFTDGLTEATNREGEEFGERRLIAMLERNKTLGARDLQAALLAAVAGFADGRLADDVTLGVLAVGPGRGRRDATARAPGGPLLASRLQAAQSGQSSANPSIHVSPATTKRTSLGEHPALYQPSSPSAAPGGEPASHDLPCESDRGRHDPTYPGTGREHETGKRARLW